MNRKAIWRTNFITAACLLLLAPLCMLSCRHASKPKEQHKIHCPRLESLPVKYAKGFTVDYYGGFKVVTVRDVMDSMRVVQQYVVLPKGKSCPVGLEGAVLIDTPVHKVVCISTTQMAEMARLDLLDSIAAVVNVPLIYNSDITARVKSGRITDIGAQGIDYEKLVTLAPAFVLTSGSYDGGDKMKLKFDALHIKSVFDFEYKEQEPLARAEWIKFISVFYNREYQADSIFNVIEKNYLLLKEKARQVTSKPTVFCNLPFKEVWYMPCGDNYMAKLIADAGGDFLWKDATAVNGLNLNLDYEAVYNKAAHADLWLNTNFTYSLQDIKAADKKNALFKAFKTGNVYNFNKRITPAGGFDFWESGAVNPDKVLSDLIYIFHPELMPGYRLYYYNKLKQQ